jgi:tetratricopeptide (TPR) repeat protein
MGGARLPRLPVLPGVDASYPLVSDYSNEYFFQNKTAYPWESVVYEDGYAYGEASTAPLLYRKMFCWGSGRGGRRWQDFLSLPGEQYLEVQAGLAPTQLHTADIDGNGAVDWVQAFTAFKAAPEKAHGEDYRAAAEYTEGRLREAIPPASLAEALEAGRRRSGLKAEICSLGSGWGVLEGLRGGIPPGLSFPEEALGDDERPWAELIRRGTLPPRPVEAGPGAFAVDPAWEALLRQSRQEDRQGPPLCGAPGDRSGAPEDPCPGDWLGPYHLGVMAFERGDAGEAVRCWKASLAAEENAWACRNLALAALRDAVPGDGKAEEALAWYKRAFHRPEGRGDPSFAEEYISLLIEQGREEEAAAELDSYTAGMGDRPPEQVLSALPGPLLDAAARIAFARRDDALLDIIFSLEPAHIREGNTTLVDLWIAREIRRSAEKGADRTAAEAHIRHALSSGELEPPREIDFRMYTRPPAS